MQSHFPTSKRALYGALSFALAVELVGGGCGGDVPTNYLKPHGGAAGAMPGAGGTRDPGDGGEAGTAAARGGEAGEAGGGGVAPSGGKGGSVTNGGSEGGTIQNGKGGSAGGSAGNGGSPPEEACGNGMVDEGEECDDNNVLDGDGCSSLCTEGCEACEAWHLANESVLECAFGPYCFDSGLPDDIATGGPAANTPRNELCLDLLACIRRTSCAKDPGGAHEVGKCYCGTSSDCSAPNGACKTEFEYAAESSNPAEVAARFTNADYAIGRAVPLIKWCDIPHCADQCLNGSAWTPPSP